MSGLTIYGDSGSGNCLKIRYVCDYLGLAYTWVETIIVQQQTRTAQFLALNPAGQVPLAVLADGRTLSQSAAIMLHLAQDSTLIPADPYARAVMFQFLFWEQYSHETAIAVRRFHKHMLGKPDAAIDPALLTRGHAALSLMESHLSKNDYFAGDTPSLADVALIAYTRLAPEGGFDLAAYQNVLAWIARTQAELRIA